MLLLSSFVFVALTLGPTNTDAPARAPQLAVKGSEVALVFGSGNSIYFAGSHNAGKTFTAPVKVADTAVLPLTRHRGPRVAFAGNEIVITAVAGTKLADGPHAHGLPGDGNLNVWRSADAGKTWSQAGAINDVPGSASEGLHALASNGAGHLFAAWLDKRAGSTRLYGSTSTDAGKSWSSNALIYASPDGSICECCHPSVAITSAGTIEVMWRNWLGGNRDMYLAASTDGGLHFAAPAKLGRGSWKLNACPMDGGGLAAANKGLLTVWRREHTIYLDQPGEEETALGQGTDAALAVNAQGPYVIWSSDQGLLLSSPATHEPRVLAKSGSFPAIAPTAAGVVAAWESNGQIETAIEH